jgi:hypothetical protein
MRSMESVQGIPARAPWPKRMGLAALMAVVATNVWIGGPIVALWIGARLQTASGGSLTIRPSTALAIFASLAVITMILAKLLRKVSDAYDRAAGVGPAARRHDSWMATERRATQGQGLSLTTLERTLVIVVALAAVAFEIWFFFFSTSPIDGRSGRSAIPLARAVPALRHDAGSAARSPVLQAGRQDLLRSAR